jgi:hypothetical protein
MNKEEEIKVILENLVRHDDDFNKALKSVIMKVLEDEIGDLRTFKEYIDKNVYKI